MKALKFENVTFGYRKDRTLFQDLSFQVTQTIGKGLVIGIMGISGSGKSTILKLILGIEKDYKGKISLTPSNAVISYVPQEPVLFDYLTPIENAEYFTIVDNYKSKFNRELFIEVAKILQIEDVLKNAASVNEISGGQRQRISLLRAMSIKPEILVLDEPLTGLDEEVKDLFLQTLAALKQRFNLMVLYVTHHRKEAEYISDVIFYLEKEKNGNAVTQVRQTTTGLFFENPPTISALNATKAANINTLYFKRSGDEKIQPIEASLVSTDSNIWLLSFKEDTIHFSSDSGFEFVIEAVTGIYTLLKLKGTQIILTINNELYEKKNNSNSKFISLYGQINLYDYNGKFLQTATIQNNQIIN